MSANSGSEGRLSGFDSLPPDYELGDGEGMQWKYPWDSSRPLPHVTEPQAGAKAAE